MQTGQRVSARAGSSQAVPLFTGTLAQNAGMNVRVPLSEALSAGRSARCIVEGIQVASFDQCAWEFWFWRNKKFQVPTNPAVERLAGVWGFASASLGQSGNGAQIGATGLYYYYIDGLGIQYDDEDAGATNPNTGQLIETSAYLNVTLVNRSVGAKTNGQWFDVSFMTQPTLGW